MPLLLFAQLLQSNRKLSCKFERNQNNSGKIRRVSAVQCLKTPKTHFLKFFWPKTQFLSFQSRLFSVATPSASNKAGHLWVGASSKTHKKTAKRFSADIKTQNKTIFWRFLVQKAILFHKMAFFFVVTPCATNWTAFLWGWASSDTHKKIRSLLVQTLKTANSPLFPYYKVATFLFQHLVPPPGRWSCEFEYSCCDTVKFRNFSVRTWKPQNTTFFAFFGPKPNFSRTKLPFSLLLHLIR